MLAAYRPLPGVRDELVDAAGAAWPEVAGVHAAIDALGPAQLSERQRLADATFHTGGITFSVYSDDRGVEKIFPFDLIPRPVSASEWTMLDAGLRQRVHALNLFLADLYGPQRVLQDGVVPRHLVEGSAGWLPSLRGVVPPHGVYVHIAGIDLIRDASGRFVVLEDNLRCPSGVSYVLENRAVLKRALPGVFERGGVASVEEYPIRLQQALSNLAPHGAGSDPTAVVLTPGPFNSAYFEHSFLARRMGLPLVQGSDLFVEDDRVHVKTTRGPQRVDVIYRRIDDLFLDPRAFRKDSMLGVPGLVGAWRKGNVTLANAPGNGVADDKAIYPYVPDVIRYFTGEDPILGQVPTYVCERPDELSHVLANLDSLVVKACDGAGGYGMLFGPTSTRAEQEDFARQLRAAPRGYIAQPCVELSTCPVWLDGRLVPRRVDLRPYVVCGPDPWVLPGGLTRVALKEGSYVVNSSQGGGSKDTWILTGAS
ncbi:MAG: circularly permuted type 2 ATP-grasp protein [Myxococcales bacterium]|nr:circularly permuted type 2 ATP-grasp protein [Myxococcales bacterium]